MISFDPRKIGHLVAYDEFRKTGHWPKGFADSIHYNCIDDIAMDIKTIEKKLASTYMEYGMAVGGMKQKLHDAKVRLMSLGDHRPETEIAIAVMGEVENLLIT